ncbi:hypothetical protein, partial [Vibrio cholerae]|uniref:hypothetical protein n=1 Tax=Vibrio cholerae TaxID=666 RepID=UPI001965D90E
FSVMRCQPLRRALGSKEYAMKEKYVLVPPKGIRLDLQTAERELTITHQNIPIEVGPEHCQIKGRIYNTVDPVESAVAEGDCLSRLHHPMTPKWVRRASQIIFAPMIILVVIKMTVSLFTMSTPNSFIELVVVALIFCIGLLILWVYWLIFVSGPQKTT